MPKWKIPIAIISWIPFILLKTFPLLPLIFFDVSWWIPFLPIGLIFLGIVLVALFSWEQPLLWPKWMWLWNNEEEKGLVPKWYKKDLPMFARIWLYYAIRNPVNNFRYLFKDTNVYTQWGYTGELESRPMVEAGVTKAVRWRQAGWKFSYRKLKILKGTKYREIYIGWKIGMSVPGLGFTFQNRKGDIGN